jgi:Spy/CpxP family protein refolding chaperone
MKKIVKIIGMALMLFLAGTLTLSAQQNMRGMRMDTTRMHRMMMNPEHMQMMMNNPDSMPMCGMRQGMRPGMMQHGMRGMGPGMMHQRMMMDNIPNLTDKQKKDIAVLRIDQQTEMQKFREEMQSKLKAIRETQRANIEKLLTPEQKKWLEENAPKPGTVQIPLDKSVPALVKTK